EQHRRDRLGLIEEHLLDLVGEPALGSELDELRSGAVLSQPAREELDVDLGGGQRGELTVLLVRGTDDERDAHGMPEDAEQYRIPHRLPRGATGPHARRLERKFLCVFARLRNAAREPSGTHFESLRGIELPRAWNLGCILAACRSNACACSSNASERASTPRATRASGWPGGTIRRSGSSCSSRCSSSATWIARPT